MNRWIGKSRGSWLWLLLVVAIAGGVGRSLHAQSIPQTSVATGVSSNRDPRTLTALLSRIVTVNVTRVSLKQAIDTIAASAGLPVQYNLHTVDAYAGPVTMHLSGVPLGVAFERALAGTPFIVVADGASRLAIVEGELAANGTVLGFVTNARTKQPVRGATVILDDSVKQVRTDSAGQFRFANIPAGLHRITVRYLGLARRTQLVTVADDQVATLTVSLDVAVHTLDEVVTTVTGDRRRLEVGNAVGTIKADSIVPTTLIRNVSDLLQARVPGMIVSNTDGSVGAPSKIRLRGINSIALNNDPIIILDGVRLNSQTTVARDQTNVGSATMLQPTIPGSTTSLAPSRLDDLDPNTIESIDVLRGPSASSLYGTDAANGVIVIKTKKGHVGSWRTSLTGDQGWSFVPGQMPDMWWGYGWVGTLSRMYSAACLLSMGGDATVVSGRCSQDSVRQFNPQNDAQMRTLGTGTARSLAANLSGGSDQLQQFLSLRTSDNVGMPKMSDVEKRIIGRLWANPAPSWMVHPNTEQDIDGSSRTTFRVSPQADISITASGNYRDVLNGGAANQFAGPTLGAGTSPSDTLGYLPSEAQRTKVTSLAKRGILSNTGNYVPWSWLSLTGLVGGDYTLRTDGADIRAQDCTTAFAVACPSGHNVRRDETFVRSANGGAALTFTPMSWLKLQTSTGEQYSHTSFYSLWAGNSDPTRCPLAFGSTLLTPGPSCTPYDLQMFNVLESRDEAATAGWYLEQMVGIFGVYTSFGFRRDAASAFGGQVNKSPPNYPKFNVSYPISDQGFFPKQTIVSRLRLRGAYGQSGNQASKAGVLNSYQFYQSTFGTSTAPTSLLALNQFGNANLKPEKGTEWEGGFDVSFLENERIQAEVTWYHKFTRDMIISSEIPASVGVGNLSQYVNIGNVENHGLELTLRAQLIDVPLFGWDVTVNHGYNRNKLVHRAPSLGAYGPSGYYSYVEGYPLLGYWGVPVVSYADVNGDHILAQNEITFGQFQYMGAPYPKSERTYVNGFDLFHRTVHVNASFDQISGLTQRLMTRTNFLPRGAVDRTAPLAEQAAWIQACMNNSTYTNSSCTNAAYLGETSSVRFNELSVTYIMPAALTRRLLQGRSLMVTFAGRNLGLWSNYVGKDPNVDTSGELNDGSMDDGSGVPQPRNFTLRFNLGL